MLYEGLVNQGDEKTPPIYEGGGVGAGGTAHAGHANWLQVMDPSQLSGYTYDHGFPKPSKWAIPSVVVKSFKPQGMKPKKKTNYLKLIAENLQQQTQLAQAQAGYPTGQEAGTLGDISDVPLEALKQEELPEDKPLNQSVMNPLPAQSGALLNIPYNLQGDYRTDVVLAESGTRAVDEPAIPPHYEMDIDEPRPVFEDHYGPGSDFNWRPQPVPEHNPQYDTVKLESMYENLAEEPVKIEESHKRKKAAMIDKAKRLVIEVLPKHIPKPKGRMRPKKDVKQSMEFKFPTPKPKVVNGGGLKNKLEAVELARNIASNSVMPRNRKKGVVESLKTIAARSAMTEHAKKSKRKGNELQPIPKRQAVKDVKQSMPKPPPVNGGGLKNKQEALELARNIAATAVMPRTAAKNRNKGVMESLKTIAARAASNANPKKSSRKEEQEKKKEEKKKKK